MFFYIDRPRIRQCLQIVVVAVTARRRKTRFENRDVVGIATAFEVSTRICIINKSRWTIRLMFLSDDIFAAISSLDIRKEYVASHGTTLSSRRLIPFNLPSSPAVTSVMLVHSVFAVKCVRYVSRSDGDGFGLGLSN